MVRSIASLALSQPANARASPTVLQSALKAVVCAARELALGRVDGLAGREVGQGGAQKVGRQHPERKGGPRAGRALAAVAQRDGGALDRVEAVQVHRRVAPAGGVVHDGGRAVVMTVN